MENSSPLEDSLGRLTEAERQVYDEICRAWIEEQKNITATEIGGILHIREGEFRRRLTSIYTKLGIKGSDQDKRVKLINNFCLKLQLVPESIILEVPSQDIEESSEAPPQPPTTGIDIEAPGGRLNRRAVAQRSALILAALVIIGVIGFVVFRGNQPAASPPEQSVPIDTPSLASRGTQLPSLAHPSPTIFGTAVATAPVEVGQVPTDTSGPTETLAPTNTLAPTIVPTNIPTLIPVGFEDNFSDGVSDLWKPLNGETQIVDGMLQSRGDDLFIAYGDTRWTDYEIEVGVDTAICGTLGNFIAVRMTDDHYLAFVFSGCGGSFWEIEGLNQKKIDGTNYESGSLKGSTVRVVVRQDEVIAYVKGIAVKSVTTIYPEGRVGLKIQKGSKITFFRVQEIQP